jgi:hypothetical protein
MLLRAPRVAPPESLREVCSTDHYQRLLHSYGRPFFDRARMFGRDFTNPPDVVSGDAGGKCCRIFANSCLLVQR